MHVNVDGVIKEEQSFVVKKGDKPVPIPKPEGPFGITVKPAPMPNPLLLHPSPRQESSQNTVADLKRTRPKFVVQVSPQQVSNSLEKERRLREQAKKQPMPPVRIHVPREETPAWIVKTMPPSIGVYRATPRGPTPVTLVRKGAYRISTQTESKYEGPPPRIHFGADV